MQLSSLPRFLALDSYIKLACPAFTAILSTRVSSVLYTSCRIHTRY
jgi:hypothetical protein